MTERASILEIDQPFCSKEYGTTNVAGTCAAALGTTGTEKCHNTRATCQDPVNYLPGTKFSTVTITIASPGVVGWTAHGLTVDRGVTFGTTGALPTGLTAGTMYYVKTIVDVNNFTVAATPGGVAINTSGSQSGTHRAIADTPLTLRFVMENQEGLMKDYAPFIPHIQKVDVRPGKINLGGMDQNSNPLGVREQVTFSLKTSKYNDLLVDKYRLERMSGQAQVSAGEMDIDFTRETLVPQLGSNLGTVSFARTGTATQWARTGKYVWIQPHPTYDFNPKIRSTEINFAEKAMRNDWAVSLNGVNQYVSIPDNVNRKYTGGDFSFEVTCQIDENDTTGGFLISKPWNNAGQYNYQLGFTENRHMYVSLFGTTGWTSKLTALPVTPNVPHTFIVVLTGATSNVKLYIDGVLEIEDTHNITSWNPSFGDLNVAGCVGTLYPYGQGWVGEPTMAVKGIFDGVHFYVRAMNAQEPIDRQKGFYRIAWNLRGRYDFEEGNGGDGASITDMSQTNTPANLPNGATVVPGIGYSRQYGDLDIRVRARSFDWLKATLRTMCAVWGGASPGQPSESNSWEFRFQTNGRLRWVFTKDGLNGAPDNTIATQSSVTPNFVNGQWRWFRVLHKVRGASGVWELKFFEAPDEAGEKYGTWSQVGTSFTGTTPGFIFHMSNPFVVGSGAAGFQRHFDGQISHVEVRSGEDGPIAGTFNLGDADPLDTQIISSSGHLHTLDRVPMTGAHLVTVADGVPRFEVSPTTLQSEGLLYEEEARTNLCPSGNLADAGWWASGNITFGTTMGVDGETCNTLTATTTAWAAVSQAHTLIPSTKYTFRVKVKRLGSQVPGSMLPYTAGGMYNNVNGWAGGLYYNLTWDPTPTVVVGTGMPGATVKLAYVGNGFYEVTGTFTSHAVDTGYGMYQYVRGGGDEVAGDIIAMTKPQIEQAAHASSYIPTTAGAATRNSESAVINGATFLNQLQGTILSEIKLPDPEFTSAGRIILQLDDGTDNERYVHVIDNPDPGNFQYRVYDGGVNQANMTLRTGYTANTISRMVTTYGGIFAGAVDGGAIQNSSSGTYPTVNRIRFGRSGFMGYQRRFAFYQRQITQLEMQAFSGHQGAPGSFIAFQTAYNPYDRGDFWGKWLARNPYHQHYDCRLIEGEVGQAISAMDTRHYLIARIDGPDERGNVSLVVKDHFSLLEARKALCPKASRGELLANITTTANTSFTLFPSGIGSEYDASGYLNIGDEVMGYTRSGDVVTTTSRGALGTTAATHQAEDLVQQVYSEVSQKAHDISYRLLTIFSKADLTLIDKAAWDTAASPMTELYTGRIATPTPVLELLGELSQQAGFTLHPNVRTKKIEFIPLRASSAIGTLEDTRDMIANTPLRVTRDDQKRVSEVWVYYAQRSPVEDVDDRQNYLSRVVLLDVAASSKQQYGTSAVREVFSRWIPAGGRNFAENAGERILFLFRDPPVEAEFSIRPNNPIAPLLAPAKTINTKITQVQDSVGKKTTLTQAITRMRRTPHTIDLMAQSVKFSAAVEGGVRTVYVEVDTPNVNFKDTWELLYGPATSTTVARIVVLLNAICYSTSTGAYAFDTGTWPAGATLTLELFGKIQAKGGAGGNGGNAGWFFANPGGAGGIGGPALKVRSPITIFGDGSGKIWSGGGGGGGGGAVFHECSNETTTFQSFLGGGGGAGGAGKDGGAGGAGGAGIDGNGGSGTGGVQTSGGSGGLGVFGFNLGCGQPSSGAGGQAGTPGVAGNAGSNANNASATGGVAASGGPGGQPGNAIEGTSLITYTGTAPQILGPTVA